MKTKKNLRNTLLARKQRLIKQLELQEKKATQAFDRHMTASQRADKALRLFNEASDVSSFIRGQITSLTYTLSDMDKETK